MRLMNSSLFCGLWTGRLINCFTIPKIALSDQGFTDLKDVTPLFFGHSSGPRIESSVDPWLEQYHLENTEARLFDRIFLVLILNWSKMDGPNESKWTILMSQSERSLKWKVLWAKVDGPGRKNYENSENILRRCTRFEIIRSSPKNRFMNLKVLSETCGGALSCWYR